MVLTEKKYVRMMQVMRMTTFSCVVREENGFYDKYLLIYVDN